MPLSQRVQGFTESVIREMTRLVSVHGGVNLAQRMPNFRPPPALIDAVRGAPRDVPGEARSSDAGTRRGGLRHVPAARAYYILTDVAHFMREHRSADDTAFAMFLIKEIGVATVPGSSFYAHGELGRTKIRFCFPKTDDVLADAGPRLQKRQRV